MHLHRKPPFNRPLLIATMLGVFASAIAYSAPARACSPPYCVPPVRLFGKDARVPGNLVYFKLLGGRTVDGELEPKDALTLETGDREPIAASVRTICSDRVFAPNEPIPAGTRVILTYTPSCYEPDRDTRVETYVFTTLESASDLSLARPRLEVLREGVSDDENEEAFSELRYHSADVTGALDHLVSSSAAVSDVRGTLFFDGTNLRVATLCADKDRDLVDTCGGIHFVPEGTHTVSVRSTIVGFAAPQTIDAEVETNCEPAVDDESVGTDPSGSAEPVKTSSGGCALVGSSSTNMSSLLATLAVLAIALRRSRGRVASRRPHRSRCAPSTAQSVQISQPGA